MKLVLQSFVYSNNVWLSEQQQDVFDVPNM